MTMLASWVDASFYPLMVVAALVFIARDQYATLLVFAALSALVCAIKVYTSVLRPDGSDRRSFPSGHSAAAWFVAATLVDAWKSRVVSALAIMLSFLWAGAVAWSRVELERHHVSDVLVGSALGLAFGMAVRCWLSRGSRRGLLLVT